eukprot:scaffold693_cov200-Alexandrium_tamarense.AAC.68
MHRWILGYSAKDDAGRTWGEVDWRNLPLGNIRKTSTGLNHRSVRRVVATGDSGDRCYPHLLCKIRGGFGRLLHTTNTQ